MSEVSGVKNIGSDSVYSINKDKKNTSGTGKFSSYLGETKTLDEIFTQAANKYGVSVDLLKAIGKQESNFNADAVSRCGAQGIMQLMPATAASLGVTDSFDAEQNIMGGAKYISELLDKYDGNTSLALAAYNAGSGNVAKYGGIPPFEETQNYVKKVTAYMNQGVNPGNTLVFTKSTDVPNIAQIKSNLMNQDSEDTLNQDLFDSIFAYDDYLKFIEIFFEDDKNEKSGDDNNYFASKAISYNTPVMNLFKG